MCGDDLLPAIVQLCTLPRIHLPGDPLKQLIDFGFPLCRWLLLLGTPHVQCPCAHPDVSVGDGWLNCSGQPDNHGFPAVGDHQLANECVQPLRGERHPHPQAGEVLPQDISDGLPVRVTQARGQHELDNVALCIPQHPIGILPIPCRGQQLLGAVEVVRRRGQVGVDVQLIGWRQRPPRWRGAAPIGLLDDGPTVDGVVQRSAELDILEPCQLRRRHPGRVLVQHEKLCAQRLRPIQD